MTSVLIALIVLIAGFAAYVRLAPSDPARFLRRNAVAEAGGVGDYPLEGGFTAVRAPSPDDTAPLAHLADIAEATDRTQLLAGSVEEGHLLYVTRSKLWGFPDYTNIYLTDDGKIVISGHLRFGRGDMGVNRKRIEAWLLIAGL